MSGLRTIVAGTDLSEASTPALWQAAHIARRTRARLLLVHVNVVGEEEADAFAHVETHFEPWDRVLQKHLLHSERALEHMERDIAHNGLPISHRVVDGKPVHALAEVVEQEHADLLVVGSHGRTGYKRVLLGSVAERVTRYCKSSVLVARGDSGVGGYRRILVATDFAEPSAIALEQAIKLAADHAVVDVLHCWQFPSFATGFTSEWAPSVYEEIGTRQQEQAEARGKRMLEPYRGRDVDLSFFAMGRLPIEGIQHHILERGPFDLVAIGTHGRKGISRFFLGSVAEATIRYSPCSVLVARQHPPLL